MTTHRPSLTLLARATLAGLAMLVGCSLAAGDAAAQVRTRIKDIADFEGVRANQLVGYGLAIGLNGTGDSSSTVAPFTQASLIGMLERLGVNTRDIASGMKTKNVAAVMVTATLPPFARQGSKIDIDVGALGDASSLLGGTLLVTPLLGADGEVYAVGQGTIAVSGFTASGAAQTITRGTPTSGRVANGAIVERETGFRLDSLKTVNLGLRNPDFTTARRVEQAINSFAKEGIATALDPGTVSVNLPKDRKEDIVGLMTDIEQLTVEPDSIARVVIDEKSGTIVMGDKVRINSVAIAQGQLTIRITETPQVSQPNAFSGFAGTISGTLPSGTTIPGATTVTVPRTDIQVDNSDQKRLAVLPNTVTLQELVNGLNALGVGPRDLITILQTIKAAGALQAEIEVI
ncbi:MAG TPA: flagellar basal body P-ring protein FlgI [Alphaproteobacteria bacterium]|nr:flagellar basal body P-ring protein FlgI [Alphaproteobacteria bacterium]